jgi:hypothetical protein
VTSGIDLTKYKGRANFVGVGQFVPGEIESSTEIKFKSPRRDQLTRNTPHVSWYVIGLFVPGEQTLTYK